MSNHSFGKSYWLSNTQQSVQFPYLSQDIECDIVVVGAGVAGALCGYTLATSGINTVVVDASVAGHANTAVSSSILSYDIDYDLRDLKNLIGIERAVRAYGACLRGLDEIECLIDGLDCDVGFRKCDSLYYTPFCENASNIKKEYLLRRQNGFSVEFIDNIKAAELFRFKIEAGIYSNDCSAEIDPYRFTMALLIEGVKSGLNVFENTHITSASPDITGITLETSTNHRIHAKKMVNATGFNSINETRRFTEPKTTYCVVTAPVADLDNWFNRCIIREDGCPYVYMRTLPDNRILIGGLSGKLVKQRGFLDNFYDVNTAVNRKFNLLEARLTEMMPNIEGIVPEYRFAGTTADTGDGLPYFGVRERYPNVFYDICCGINGIVFAQLGADIIRDLYYNNEPEDMDLFAFGRI